MSTIEITDGQSNPQRQLALILSLLLAAMVALASGTGLLVVDFYFRETANWQAQAVGQDLVNIFLILPVLIISAITGYMGSYPGKMIWGGSLIYLLYTFAIYAFDVHFNEMFLVYCLALGLAFYSSILFFSYEWKVQKVWTIKSELLRRITGIYFLLIAVMFYFLWLSEILPDQSGPGVPEILEKVGLPTNPVHVLDLSFLLPGTLLREFSC